MEHDYERNFDGRFSRELGWEMSNRSLRMRTMTVLKSSPTNSTRRVVQYFYQNSVVCFRKQKAFVLKTVFSHTWLRQVKESVRTRDMGLSM